MRRIDVSRRPLIAETIAPEGAAISFDDHDFRRHRNAGRTSRQEINVGLSTLQRDALDGHLEIHVVLDDADTKLTALERPPTRKKEMARRPIP